MAGLIGKQIGPYKITDRLGSGGMATVYRARQSGVGREVAIKVIASNLAEDPIAIGRFEREARIIANLSHPNILKLFDYGHVEGMLYFVTELQSGGSLAEKIRNQTLSLDETAQILEQIASALDYTHRKDIVHRDLKPSNVLLDETGNATLSDFGIVKVRSVATDGVHTSAGVLGTPKYMAPEQWQNQPIDWRTDIYALGILLHEMLTGRLPFERESNSQFMHAHVYEQPEPIRRHRADIPPEVEYVIARALAKKPSARYQSAGEFARAYRAAISEAPRQQIGRIAMVAAGLLAFFLVVALIFGNLNIGSGVVAQNPTATASPTVSPTSAVIAIQFTPINPVIRTSELTRTATASPTLTIPPPTAKVTQTPTVASSPTALIIPPSATPPATTTHMPTATPSATLTATATAIPPSATWTVSPTHTPSSTRTPTPSPSPTATLTPSSTATLTPTHTPTSTATASPTRDPLVTPTLAPGATRLFNLESIAIDAVYLGNGQWVNRNAVTPLQYRVCAQATRCVNLSQLGDPVFASWNQASRYCAFQFGGRLLTRAEFERAFAEKLIIPAHFSWVATTAQGRNLESTGAIATEPVLYWDGTGFQNTSPDEGRASFRCVFAGG